MKLLFIPDGENEPPTRSEVRRSWAVGLPVGGMCLYAAGGLVTSGAAAPGVLGLGVVLGLAGLGSLAWPVLKTHRRRRAERRH